MDAVKRRLLELEEIYRFAIDGLRSKAKVAANDRISGNVTDPAAILNAAANELQIYLGSAIEVDFQSGSMWYLCNQLEVTVDGQGRQFGPMPDQSVAVRVLVDLEQRQILLRNPIHKTVAARPAGLAMKIEIHPEPNSEIAQGGIHDDSIH